MSCEREYDFVVFGATGFTGKYVCVELYNQIKGQDLKWAIAGRNVQKLEDIKSWFFKTSKIPESEKQNIGLIEADVANSQSLYQMCKQAKVILNCVGPFRFFGEAVVKECLAARTDYVDVSGEPEFLELMEFKYNETAEKEGVFIVGACGFDSIPSDLGVVYAKKKFEGTICSIENYFTITTGPSGSKGNFGTYASIVHSISNTDKLQDLRRKIRQQQTSPVPVVGPKLKKPRIHYSDTERCYSLPFLGSDIPIVKRSQRYFYIKHGELPIQYAMYQNAQSFGFLLAFLLFGLVLTVLTKFSFGKKLLLDYPEFFTAGHFSKTGPSEKQMEETGFNFLMHCKGYKDKTEAQEAMENPRQAQKPTKEMDVKITGPEIGYVLTPIVLVQSALCLIKERSKMPERGGGVLTTAAAFSNTDILDNLQKNGIKFEVIPK